MKKGILHLVISVILATIIVVEEASICFASATPTNLTTTETEEIIYSEDFDSYGNETIQLETGINYSTSLFFAKKSSSGAARIENGKLYLSGNGYDVVYVDGGSTWGNYTVEADITYLANTGWAGMLFNAQSGTKFQKASLSMANRAAVNGYNNGWVNDVNNVNKKNYTTGLSVNQPYRMKIEVNGRNATLYYAIYNADGTLPAYTEVMSISNIPSDQLTGSVGFMTSSGAFCSIAVDNIVVKATTPQIFTEDFESYGNMSLTSGSNSVPGIYFQQNSGSASAQIVDGHLVLSGNNYDQIHFETGLNWTNYTLEADMCYLSSSGWGGLLYRTASGTSSQKAGLTIANRASLNGFTSKGGWYKDVEGVTKKNYTTGLSVGTVFRMKIVVHENSSSLYYAIYNSDGSLPEYTYVMSVSDNFPDVHMTGSIGAMTSSGSTCSFWIDNICVTRGEPRYMTAPNVADVYVPQTGIVNPPVVIQKISNSLPSELTNYPAVAMMNIDSSLNIVNDSNTPISTVDSFMSTYGDNIIPAFIIDSATESTALTTYLSTNNIIDAFVVADTAHSNLIKTVRETYGVVRGVLWTNSMSTDAERKAALVMANTVHANVIATDGVLDIDDVTYFNMRMIATWATVSDEVDVYSAIASGLSGVIAANPEIPYGVYASITETTISGRPLPIAHRGHALYPENTLLAYQKALDEGGCLAVEIDLRWSSDGEIVIMHDSTIDRTTNGSGAISSYTVEELKQFDVDHIPGYTDKIPTLEEVFEAFENTDLVFVCHVNVKTPAVVNRFNELVEEYDYQDRVVFFISYTDIDTFNYTNVTTGIPFASGNAADLIAANSDLKAIEGFINELAPYSYQPLFYHYGTHSSQAFYYSVAARGFVSWHSTTNGQSNLDSVLMTQKGAIAALTDHPHLAKDYAYVVDASNQTLSAGTAISLTQTAVTLTDSFQTACGLVQLSGPNLTQTGSGYTLNTSGEVVVAYYADITQTHTNGTSITYRIYSMPVTITFH